MNNFGIVMVFAFLIILIAIGWFLFSRFGSKEIAQSKSPEAKKGFTKSATSIKKDFVNAQKEFTQMVLQILIADSRQKRIKKSTKDLPLSQINKISAHISTLQRTIDKNEVDAREYASYPKKISKIAQVLGEDSLINMIQFPDNWENVEEKKQEVYTIVDSFDTELTEAMKRINKYSYEQNILSKN